MSISLIAHTNRISSRDEDERRLHSIASKTKDILKELAEEMNRRKKLSKVIHTFIQKPNPISTFLG